jgi:hypothetical protein
MSSDYLVRRNYQWVSLIISLGIHSDNTITDDSVCFDNKSYRLCVTTMNALENNQLPYRDTKPQGAPDFYFATNATFRFLIGKLGRPGWIQYLQELGRTYFAPVNENWRTGGLPAVTRYWRDFFAAEPGGRVEVKEQTDRVEVYVHECPAIKHLKTGGRELVKEYCQHCYFLGQARAEAAGLTMRLCGGNGACRHTYAKVEAGLPPQAMTEIEEAHR